MMRGQLYEWGVEFCLEEFPQLHSPLFVLVSHFIPYVYLFFIKKKIFTSFYSLILFFLDIVLVILLFCVIY